MNEQIGLLPLRGRIKEGVFRLKTPMARTHETEVSAPPQPGAAQHLRKHLPTILLASSMFLTGASGYLSEILLSTVSTYILGNSVEQFTVIIALMLLMMGAGTYMQRFISDSRLIEKFILIEIALALLVGFAPIAIYAAFGVVPHYFHLVQYTFIISIGFLVGFEIPVVLRINQSYARSLGSNIATTYAFDYIGACVAGFIFVYWLLKTLPLTEISFIFAAANFIVAVATFAYFWTQGKVERPWLAAVVVVVTIAALGFGYSQNRGWNQDLEQRLYRDKIVFSETTRYQRLVVTRNRELDEYRFYINGNLQFSSLDERIYHEHLVHPAMALVADHRKVLVLGGGDGLALREVLKYGDVESVTVVDLDPDVVRLFSGDPLLSRLNDSAFADARVATLATDALSPQDGSVTVYQRTELPKSARRPETRPIADVTVFNVDADRFLDRVTGRWDVVFIDLPDPNSIELAKLYSKEFYLKLQGVLEPGAVVALQSTSPYHAKEAFLAIVRTLRAAGFHAVPYHDNVPSFGEWGWVLASRHYNDADAVRLILEGIDSFPVPTEYLTPEASMRSFVFGKGWLQSDNTDISTLMRPRVLDYYLHDAWKTE